MQQPTNIEQGPQQSNIQQRGLPSRIYDYPASLTGTDCKLWHDSADKDMVIAALARPGLMRHWWKITDAI